MPGTDTDGSTILPRLSHLKLDPEDRRRLLTDVVGDHRLVTVVFADLTSSVARTEQLHPEEAARLVNSLLEAMVETLLRYGGRIDRFLGDGALAVFGIPETRENDPERAVRAALELRERAVELGLGASIGINTGRVYFGPVGSRLHEELTVMGPVVNLAARLQGQAAEGEVIVGPGTYQHVRAAFELTPVDFEIKGVAGVVTAYRAERLLDRPEKVRGIEGLHARLIGRGQELAALEAATTSRFGSLTAVVGEAGVGKSRLVSEFHRRFTGQGGRWAESRCLELDRDTAFRPIVDLLLSLAGPAGPGGIIETGFDDEWQEEVAPFLLALFGGPAPDRVERTAPEQRRALTRTAVCDFVEACLTDAPTVLFIDDLHWADDASISVVESLLMRLGSKPGAILATMRPDAASPAGRLVARLAGERSARLELPQLTPAESREMIGSLLDIDRLDPELENRILARAEGNPFYVEEIVRALIQRGTIFRSGRVWVAEPDSADVEIPESVQAVVMSRVDRLQPAVRRWAQLGSVLGRAFTQPVLEALGQGPAGPALNVLATAGVVVPERAARFSFVHALTHEGVYDTMLPSRRAELHEAAGAVLAAGWPEEIDQIAYHYGESRNDGLAATSALTAAEHALDSYLMEPALAHLERGLVRAGSLPGPEGRRIAARLRARRGEVLERAARYREAQADLIAALDAGGLEPPETARLLTLLGRSYRLGGEYDEAHARYDEAEAALEAGPRSAAREQRWIDVQKERAFALYFGGEADQLPALNERTGPVVAEHGTGGQRADYLSSLALQSLSRDRYLVGSDALGLAEEARMLAEAAADAGQIAEMRFLAGFTALWADDPLRAVDALESAIRDARRTGHVMLENRALSYRAVALRRLGRADEATAAAEPALRLARELGSSYYAGHALATLCWAAWRRGDVDGAASFGADAVSTWSHVDEEEATGLGTDFGWMVVWPLVALAADADDLEEALRLLRYLQAPWERRMPADLADAVADAADLEGVRRALALAEMHRLL